MHFPIVAKILGMLLMTFSLTMLVPIIVALIYDETTISAFFLAFALTFSIGTLIWLPYARETRDMRTRDGFFVTVMFWTVLGLFGSLPLIFSAETPVGITDAVFESVSGLTTTGATVLSGLEELPKSILFYRQQLQWLGGIGIVVIAIAILPMLGVGGMQLYRTEIPGPVKDAKLTPRIAQTAKALFSIYVGLTVACAIAYRVAGMNTFDAIAHSFSTVAIGGFSTYDASIGHFDSVPIMMVCVFFMVLSAMNFGLHYFALLRLTLGHYWRDPEARFYLSILGVGAVLVCGFLWLSGTYGWSDSLYHGLFQLVSIATTAGFASDNFSAWPPFAAFLLIVLSFFGGCAGSTGGGIKMGRMLLLAKQGIREIHRLIHPNAVLPLKLRNRSVSGRVSDAVWGFFGAYLAAYYIITMALLATGMDFITAWSATAAAINNLGPGLGDVAANYGDITPFAKWLLSGTMLLGRLEVFTLLVVLTPMFWRR